METDTTPQATGQESQQTAPETTAAPEMPTTMQGLLDAMSAPVKPQGATPESDTLQAEVSSQDDSVSSNAESEEGEQPEDGDATGQSDEGDEGDEGEDSAGGAQPEGKAASKNFRGRWDHLNDQERRVVELTTKKGLSLAEAYRSVYGESEAPAAAPVSEEAKPDPVVAIDEQLVAKQAELDALEEAIDGGAFDRDAKADRKKQRELMLELSELRADKRHAQRQKERDEAQAATTQQEQWEVTHRQSLSQLEEAFPDAVDAGTEFGKAVVEEIAYLQSSNAPLLLQPNFPLLVVQRIARQLGIRPAAATPAPEATPAHPNPTPSPSAPKAGQQAPKIRPVPAGGSPAAPMTLEQQMAQAKGNKEQMLELMKLHGTPLVS